MKKIYSFLMGVFIFNASCYALSIDANEPRLIVADKIEYNVKA